MLNVREITNLEAMAYPGLDAFADGSLPLIAPCRVSNVEMDALFGREDYEHTCQIAIEGEDKVWVLSVKTKKIGLAILTAMPEDIREEELVGVWGFEQVM